MAAADVSTKIQSALWWIASIAISVFCCSSLFVLFASYLVDVKVEMRENSLRINMIEERQDKILTELELIRKHMVMQPGPTPVVQIPPTNLIIDGAPPDKSVPENIVAPPAVSAPALASPPSSPPPTPEKK